MSIKFGHGFQIPVEAITETFAFIGKRGSGKTFAAKRLAEGMLEVGGQVVVFDRVGKWWALRRSADGKGVGFDILVLGGAHGDVPLEPEAGAVVARFIVESGRSCVIDVSHFRERQCKQFLADLAEELFHLKKTQTNNTPVHIFIEEAQRFIPEQPRKDEKRIVDAFEDMILIGRNFGIGCTLITLRPQGLKKSVLNQTECLVIGRLPGPHERKAMKTWVQQNDVPDLEELLNEMPHLETEYKLFWSPSFLGVFKKIRVLKIKTFDSTRTPKPGDKRIAQEPLPPIDLVALTAEMESAIERAKEDDPKALRERIRELEQDLIRQSVEDDDELREAQQRIATLEAELERQKVVPVEVSVLTDESVELIEDAVERGREIALAMQVAADQMARDLAQAKSLPQVPEPVATPAPPAPRVAVPTITRSVTLDLPPRQQGILDGLRELETVGQLEPSRLLLAFWIERGAKSSTFGNDLSAMRSAGLIDYPGKGSVALTETGRAGAQSSATAPTSEVLQRKILAKLPPRQRELIEILLDNHPDAITRDELAELAERGAKSSTYGNDLGFLHNTLGIVDYPAAGEVKAGSMLFIGGRE